MFFIRYEIFSSKLYGAWLVCPNCGRINVCSCKSCRNDRKQYNVKGFKEYKWQNNDFIKCGYCGFEAHVDYWYFDSCLAKYLDKRRQ